MKQLQISRIGFGQKKYLKKKFKIFYDSSASVFHHHGIHHSLNSSRSHSTLKILNKNR